MGTKHTPTPWQSTGGQFIYGRTEKELSYTDNHIGVFNKTIDGNHAIKCVNLHDELVEALEKHAQNDFDKNGASPYQAFLNDLLNRARGES